MLSALVLVSTSLSGCLGKRLAETDPTPPPQSNCREANAEEWAGFRAIVQVAQAQRKLGDEYHVAAATEWIGSILFSCFPERFEPVPPTASTPPTPPAPPAKVPEKAPAKAPAVDHDAPR
jgi:hypothetical protein